MSKDTAVEEESPYTVLIEATIPNTNKSKVCEEYVMALHSGHALLKAQQQMATACMMACGLRLTSDEMRPVAIFEGQQVNLLDSLVDEIEEHLGD